MEGGHYRPVGEENERHNHDRYDDADDDDRQLRFCSQYKQTGGCRDDSQRSRNNKKTIEGKYSLESTAPAKAKFAPTCVRYSLLSELS